MATKTERFLIFYKTAPLIALALAVGALVYMNSGVTQTFSVTYSAANELGTVPGAIGPAERTVWEWPLKAKVTILLLTLAISSLIFLKDLDKNMQKAAKGKSGILRWVESAIIGALAVELSASLAGITELIFIKLLVALVVVGSLLGLASQRLFEKHDKSNRLVFVLAATSSVLPWLFIFHVFAGTYLYGRLWLPWYVYAVWGAGLLGAITNMANLWFKLKGRQKDGIISEQTHFLNNFCSSIIIALLIIRAYIK